MPRFVAWMASLMLTLASCDVAEDTADTSKGGAKGAAGIADKMSAGTAGDADLDSGETADDAAEDAAGG